MAHRYTCDDCGTECTVGTPGGPATMDTERRTRCWECQHLWEQKRGAVAPRNQDELTAITVALSQIADDGPRMVVTPTVRKLATDLLSRLERYRQ